MNMFFKAKMDREQALGGIMGKVLEAFSPNSSSGPIFQFPAFNFCGVQIDGIGAHYGLDHSLYYDLYSSDRKILSANDWRLEDCLSDVPESKLRKVYGSLKPAAKTKEHKQKKLSLAKGVLQKIGGPRL